jgi:hypothetical protein
LSRSFRSSTRFRGVTVFLTYNRWKRAVDLEPAIDELAELTEVEVIDFFAATAVWAKRWRALWPGWSINGELRFEDDLDEERTYDGRE